MYGMNISKTTNIVFVLYLVGIVAYTLNAWTQVNCTLPDQQRQILDWKWNKAEGSQLIYGLFLLCLTMLSFSLPSNNMKILFACANLISFYVSTKTPIFNFSVGRIWCYYASIMPALFLFALPLIN
jgi:hypothetical protein